MIEDRKAKVSGNCMECGACAIECPAEVIRIISCL
ncbi:MAG: 4Fe-4S binding protein [Oscillospiraceae bacterium]|nr:4Fe-4S binding protein [Oscillospiraceae bacterium]